jgi:NADPH-dependent ferric siderophore reductase
VHNLRHALHSHHGRWSPEEIHGSPPCSTAPPKPSPTEKRNEYSSHPSRHARNQTPPPGSAARGRPDPAHAPHHLGRPELAGFISLGTDDHVKLLFPQNAAEQAALETLASISKATARMPAMRDYTPRRYDLDTGELDIDFVLHGDGPASTWAAQAAPGHLHIGGPRLDDRAGHVRQLLLIGDETALPAIAGAWKAAGGPSGPGGDRDRKPAERQALESAAEVKVIWVVRGRDDLLSTVRSLKLPRRHPVRLVATETKLSRQMRRVLLDDPWVDEAFVKAVGYWRAEGSEED